MSKKKNAQSSQKASNELNVECRSCPAPNTQKSGVQRTQRGMLLLSGDHANRQGRQQCIHAWLIVQHSKRISTCVVAQKCIHVLNLQHLSLQAERHNNYSTSVAPGRAPQSVN